MRGVEGESVGGILGRLWICRSELGLEFRRRGCGCSLVGKWLGFIGFLTIRLPPDSALSTRAILDFYRDKLFKSLRQILAPIQ
jgi:hypothetical protein